MLSLFKWNDERKNGKPHWVYFLHAKKENERLWNYSVFKNSYAAINNIIY